MSTEGAGLDAAAARRAIALGRTTAALGGLVEALAAGRGAEPEARLLGRLFTRFAVDPSPLVERALRRACSFEAVDLQPFARCLAATVLADPGWSRLTAEPAVERWSPDDLAALRGGFLTALLRRCVNRSLAIERGCHALRRALLFSRTVPMMPAAAALVTDLALQAANNEYAWPIADDEAAALQRIAVTAGDAAAVLRAAMFRPPATMEESIRGLPESEHEALRALLDATLPSAQERQHRASMPRLRAPTDAVSRLVQAQYEENPYPRWLAINPPDRDERRAALVRRAGWSAARLGGPLDILIAGCGTGRQAVAASIGYGDRARILAIDLSAASLAYAERMARHYGCGNLRFLQADLLDLDHLDRDFDVVEAIGVLHHLRDPMAGWRRLVGRLRPGGLLQVALYSERARRDVVAARTEIERLGLPATADGVRALRRIVLDAPPDARDWRASLPRFGDFFSTSGCRDLVFHVEEHRFTPIQVGAALAALGLAFLGFDLPAPTLAAFARRHRAPESQLDLARWDDFERGNPDVFAGMMTFWCRRPG